MSSNFEMQKNPYPTVTSKMLDPTDDETAMSPLPCLATNTLVIKSREKRGKRRSHISGHEMRITRYGKAFIRLDFLFPSDGLIEDLSSAKTLNVEHILTSERWLVRLKIRLHFTRTKRFRKNENFLLVTK